MQNNNFEMYTPQIKPEDNLSVYESGYEKCEPHIFHGPLGKHCYYIHFVMKGKGIYETGGKRYEINPNEGFLIRPWEIVYYGPDADDPWEYYWVGFNGLDAKRLLKLSGLEQEYTFSYTKDNILKNNLICLHHASKKVSSREYAMIGYLYLVFSCLIDVFYSIKDKASQKRIMKVLAYIEQNYDKDINIENISKKFSISRSQLYKVFEEQLNISPIEYLINYRLNKACLLLQVTDMAVYEIGIAVGFRDIIHFSKIFKKKIGITPTEYRRQNMKSKLSKSLPIS
jgi:AraC-like DNA-binding protein